MKKITQNLTKSLWRSGLIAITFLFSLTINLSAQETVLAVWDFNEGSTEGVFLDGITFDEGANIALGWLKNGDQTGVSDPNSVVASGRNGYSGGFLGGSNLTPAQLADGKLHISITLNNIDLTAGADGTTAAFKFFLKGIGNPANGENHRMAGVYIDPDDADLKVRSIVFNNGIQTGGVKDVGGLGTSSVYSDQITLGTTMDFINHTSSFWVGSPGENPETPFGLTMATNAGNQSTAWNAATQEMSVDAVVKLLQFQMVNGSGSIETDQFKISTGTYENTAAAGDETSTTSESIPWTDSFESTDVWTNDSGSYPWTYGLALSFENPPAAAQDGDGVVFFDDYSYSTGSTGTIMSPEIDLSTATAPIMTFYHYDADGADTVEVIDGVGTVLFTTPSTSAEWTKFTVDLSAYIGGSVQVGFKGTSVYGYSNPHIDNVYVGETPTEPAMSVSATTDGGSATFSFTIDNFTVGAAAGEGDGHIHWSIFSASDLNTPIYENVMVYSTEDYTLSPLPNGDHVIVFSLVDPSHQPLDPAVDATVEFSTFDGTAACDETVTYTQVANGDYTVALTAPDGQVASVTVNGNIESGYDFINVTDGAGNALNADQNTGVFTDAVFTSTDGTISVNVTNDGSVQNGDVTLAFSCAAAEEAALSLQGIIDFSLPGKYMKGIHVKASADIADLSMYSIEAYSSGDRLTPSNLDNDGNSYVLSGSASEGDDLLFWMSNADDAANIYMNASGIFDVVVEESEWNGYNGDDPITLSMNGTVLETFGELGVDGTGEAWEYTDTWAYKVDGAWTHGVVNCTDGSYFTWDSGCTYPLAVGQQATDASADLVTAFSEDMNVVPAGGFWYNETEAPIERKTASNVPGSDTSAMQYVDSGEFLYSNMQIQFTSKVDMNSMNTYTVDVYVDGTTTTGTAPVNLALKLQDSSEDSPWTNQNVVVQDIALDTWTTLTFEFNDSASMSRDDVDRIVVQFNGEGNNDAVTAYMKNMVGSYTEPATTAVTFNVDMSQYGLADGDTVHVNGEFTGWCGDCGYNIMSDDDGDGIYSLTLQLDPGSYFWKYTVNGWNAQEGFSEAIDGCTADNNGNFDRQVVVGAEALELSYCWNSCEAAGSCSPVEPILMPIDHENESVNYAWNDFGGAATSVIANPDASGVNTSATVAQSIKTANSETWAGTFIVLDEQLDFSTITTLAVDVWTPDGGELVNLKVENAADGNIAIELNQPTTVAAGWETLYYDLSGGDLSQVYDKLVFFFDFNVGGDDTAYYFDNIRLEEEASIAETCDFTLNLTDSYGDGWNGGAAITVLVNGVVVLDGATVTVEQGTAATYTFEALEGDVITSTWTAGTWDSETGIELIAPDGSIAASITVGSTADLDITSSVACTGLSTVEAMVLDMRIYPNPSNGSYVTIQTPVNGVKYVEVFDITGKRLINTSLSTDTLDVSSISSGMYLVKVTVEGQSKTSKLIIR